MRARDRITITAAAVAIAAAVLSAGGAPRWSLAVVAVPTVVAVIAQLRSRRGLDRTAPLMVLLAIALGLTVVQALPLPASAQTTLDPVGAELVDDGAALSGDVSNVRPLSLDPPNTRRAALEFALALALAWVLLRLASSPTGRYQILGAVAATAGLAAAIGGLNALVGARTLYGLYTPHSSPAELFGPLLNGNSYASLLVLGALVSAGLAIHVQHSNLRRVAFAVNAALCLGIALATQSRGGALAAAFGTLTLIAVLLMQRRRREVGDRKKPSFLRVTVPATIVVVCAVALVVLTSAGGVARQLDGTSVDEFSDPLSKYAAWRSAGQLIRETPWIGVGRGGFESAFPRVHAESAYGTFSHLENEYLQAVVDWGIPGALALAVAAAWLALAAGRRRREGPLAAGAIAALVAVAAQATVDFGLELLGLMLPVIAVTATLTYVPLREFTGRRLRWARVARAALLLGIVLGVAVVVPPWGRTLADDHDELAAQTDPSLDDLHAAMRRHPLDYYAAARAAMVERIAAHDAAKDHRPVEEVEAHRRATMQYLNRALVLHPNHGGLHRLAGQILASTGHAQQARLEFRTALRVAGDPTSLLGEILKWFPVTADAVGALPADYPNTEGLARALIAWKRTDVALAYLQRTLAAHGVDPDVLELLEQAALAQGDLATAEDAIRRQIATAPTVTLTVRLGRVLIKREQFDAAEQTLGKVPTMSGPPGDVAAGWLLLCDLRIRREAWIDAEACLQQMMGSKVVNLEMRRAVHIRMATVAEKMGNRDRAALERKLARDVR
ncbi:MAG: O-antigen ligase family protein [Deltaproteobacteria bacterium]|nr:O-antigen ligase family protein [Deltaproteobacteria bacterium]